MDSLLALALHVQMYSCFDPQKMSTIFELETLSTVLLFDACIFGREKDDDASAELPLFHSNLIVYATISWAIRL